MSSFLYSFFSLGLGPVSFPFQAGLALLLSCFLFFCLGWAGYFRSIFVQNPGFAPLKGHAHCTWSPFFFFFLLAATSSQSLPSLSKLKACTIIFGSCDHQSTMFLNPFSLFFFVFCFGKTPPFFLLCNRASFWCKKIQPFFNLRWALQLGAPKKLDSWLERARCGLIAKSFWAMKD